MTVILFMAMFGTFAGEVLLLTVAILSLLRYSLRLKRVISSFG